MHIFKSTFSSHKKFIHFRGKIKFVMSSSQACNCVTTLATAKISSLYTTYPCYAVNMSKY